MTPSVARLAGIVVLLTSGSVWADTPRVTLARDRQAGPIPTAQEVEQVFQADLAESTGERTLRA